MTQRDQILDFMKKYGSITRLDALKHCGCINLPGRIYDLKDRGIGITTHIIAVRKADGSTAYVAEYRLEEQA